MKQYPPEIVPAKRGGFTLKHTGPTGDVSFEGRDGYVTRFPENTLPFRTLADVQAKYDEKYGGAT